MKAKTSGIVICALVLMFAIGFITVNISSHHQLAFRENMLRHVVDALVTRLLPEARDVYIDKEARIDTEKVSTPGTISIIEPGVGGVIYRVSFACNNCKGEDVGRVSDFIRWLIKYSPGDPQILKSYNNLTRMPKDAFVSWRLVTGL